MIEHINEPSKLIKKIVSLSNDNSHLFLSTINRNIKSFLLAKIMAEYVFGLVPKGTHQYAKFITPSDTSDDCNRVPVRTHYPSYLGVPNSYWDTSMPFDENLPDANMINDFGDPPEGTQSPKRFTKGFEKFYKGTGITKMFSVNGHPTIDRLKASGNLEITHPELSYLV